MLNYQRVSFPEGKRTKPQKAGLFRQLPASSPGLLQSTPSERGLRREIRSLERLEPTNNETMSQWHHSEWQLSVSQNMWLVSLQIEKIGGFGLRGVYCQDLYAAELTTSEEVAVWWSNPPVCLFPRIGLKEHLPETLYLGLKKPSRFP